ncbi:hypothetical protein CVS40_7355 [Lucilia cuprina]|nr:hypothetical protein CVS40_7355 [Lucilia cuprina]
MKSGVCVKPYPEIVSLPTEERVLCSFHKNLRKINESNSHMALSFEAIRSSQAELNYRCEQLNKSWALLLDPADSVSIEDYITLLKLSKQCDLMEILKNCSCLRPKRRECIKCHKNC